MISIIICSIDSGKFAAVSAAYARQMGPEPYEIIGIHDARSLSEGYNRGLRAARGDICVFSHDDIEILSENLGATLRRHLAEWDVVGVAGTTRLAAMFWAVAGISHARGIVTHRDPQGYSLEFFGAPEIVNGGIQALDGLFIAARREVAERIRFDETTFDGWHGYDTDFTFRCHLAGYHLAVCLDIQLIHFSRGSYGEIWHRYGQRFSEKHAAHLWPQAGPWLTIRRPLESREAIVAAYDLPALQALTRAVQGWVAGE